MQLNEPEKQQAELEQAVSDVLAEARRRGASAAEASAHRDRGLSATVRLGEVETIEHTRDRGLSVTVYLGRSKGHASSADLSEETQNQSISISVERNGSQNCSHD